MPGQHSEGSIGDCIESVLEENPDLDEESAARICNDELRAELSDEQIDVLTALAPSLDDEAWNAALDRLTDSGTTDQSTRAIIEGLSDEAIRDIERRYNVTVQTECGAATGDDGVAVQQRSSALGVDVPDGPEGVYARQTDTEEFDPDNPPEEYREAIEADNFIIYGKASVEKVDLMGTRFSVDALERALGRFFESEDAPGIISRGHADVPVGRPIREWTLQSDTVIDLGDETHQFDAGETIRTEAKDADNDDVPELWLASRLANDSDIARETRYQALTGQLDGYSVTIKPKDGATRQTGDSEDILALDLHAVTVGTDDQILNPESKFDVAEFRAIFGDSLAHSDDADAVAEALGRRLATLLS